MSHFLYFEYDQRKRGNCVFFYYEHNWWDVSLNFNSIKKRQRHFKVEKTLKVYFTWLQNIIILITENAARWEYRFACCPLNSDWGRFKYAKSEITLSPQKNIRRTRELLQNLLKIDDWESCYFLGQRGHFALLSITLRVTK